MRVTYLCRRCARPSVTRDAQVRWDLRRQRWVIDELRNVAWCQACDAETALIEREVGISPAAPIVEK